MGRELLGIWDALCVTPWVFWKNPIHWWLRLAALAACRHQLYLPVRAGLLCARELPAPCCQPSAGLVPIGAAPLLGNLHTVLEEIHNWGNGNEEMIQTDSARDWGRQLEMLKKTKTLINILVLYRSLPHSTNQKYSETLFF